MPPQIYSLSTPLSHQQFCSNGPDPLPLVSRVLSLLGAWLNIFLRSLCIKRLNASIKPAIKITQTNEIKTRKQSCASKAVSELRKAPVLGLCPSVQPKGRCRVEDAQ